MYIKLAASVLVSTALMLPMAGYTADSEHSSASTMVKDSVITTKIKAELAAEKMSSLVHISAKAVRGVTTVDNQIKVVADK